MRWIKDGDFIRGEIPMTKFEVRAVTIALLDIEEHDVLLDIGAGTGSISVQAALHGAEVYAIEKSLEGVELIRKNAHKFEVTVHVFQGIAPEAVGQIPEFNKCFIGGSGGRLGEIIKSISARLPSEGIVVANFIRLENLVKCKKLLHMYNFEAIEARLFQTAVADKRGLLRGHNPVVIIKGEKA
jgi:cobalt-precorrin-6B (C15)-methyltransferase